MTNVIIYLIGFAGIGKLTIAKELSKLTNARIIDNHLINNPILSLIPLDGKTPIPKVVWERIANIREIVFTTIEELSPPYSNFIFTNELLESSTQDKEIYRRIAVIAQKRKSTFVPIRLIANLDELCRRVSSVERTAHYEMTCAESTKEKYRKEALFMPETPLTQTIDITDFTPKEAAGKKLTVLKTLEE